MGERGFDSWYLFTFAINRILSNMSDKHFYSRKSPRAQFAQYDDGDYFVTICTQDMAHYFGYISDGEMHLNELGEHCCQQFEELSLHYPYATVVLYVVMPNHVHAILRIASDETMRRTQRAMLGIVVGGLKREVKLFAKRHCIQFGWHNRYHDHIIRGALDGNRIVDYIRTNVERWDKDCYNPERI